MYIYFFISDFFFKKNERTKTNEKAEIERRAKRLRELAASVPPEPSADAKNLCTLAIRWPDGRSISRRFDANEKLSVVKAFCEAQDKLPAYSKLCLVQKKKSFILLILLFYFFTQQKGLQLSSTSVARRRSNVERIKTDPKCCIARRRRMKKLFLLLLTMNTE